MDFDGIGLFGMFALIAVAAICSGAAVEITKTLNAPCECACAAEVPHE